MKKEKFALISGIITGVAGIAEAVLAYVDFKYKVPCIACVPVVQGAIITCTGFFVKEGPES